MEKSELQFLVKKLIVDQKETITEAVKSSTNVYKVLEEVNKNQEKLSLLINTFMEKLKDNKVEYNKFANDINSTLENLKNFTNRIPILIDEQNKEIKNILKSELDIHYEKISSEILELVSTLEVHTQSAKIDLEDASRARDEIIKTEKDQMNLNLKLKQMDLEDKEKDRKHIESMKEKDNEHLQKMKNMENKHARSMKIWIIITSIISMTGTALIFAFTGLKL